VKSIRNTENESRQNRTSSFWQRVAGFMEGLRQAIQADGVCQRLTPAAL